jgi:hypothetical protein
MNVNPVGKDLLLPDPSQDAPDGAQVASPQFTLTLNQLVEAVASLWASGPTSARPKNPVLSQLFYDSTLSQMLICTAPATSPNTSDAVWVQIGGSVSSIVAKVVTATGAGTFTWPANIDMAWITMIGGGGGGGGAGGLTPGSTGGGMGGFVYRFPFPRSGVATTSYSVGVAGAAGALGNNPGGAGGDSVFGTLTVSGGKGGTSTGANNNGANGGAVGGTPGAVGGTSANPGNPGVIGTTVGSLVVSGSSSGGSGNAVNVAGGAGGPSLAFAGGAGGPGNANESGASGGAASPFGAGAAGVLNAAALSPASTAYGAGAGGVASDSNRVGAAGIQGILIIEYEINQ